MSVFRTANALPLVIDDVSNIIERHPNKPIVWFTYPYNHWVDVLQMALISRGQRIDYIVDNDKKKWGKVSANGVMISPPADILASHPDAIFLISSPHKDVIIKQIKSYDISDTQIKTLKLPEEYSEQVSHEFEVAVADKQAMSLREIQLGCFEILKRLRDFCNSHELRYYLAGGTCFGASYYKGFVPWDDDIDIYLPYDDYLRFIDIFPQSGRFQVLDCKKNDTFFWPYSQMVDTEIEVIYGSFPVSVYQNLFIDVVPLMGLPDNRDEIDYRFEMIRYLDSQWYPYYFSKEVDEVDYPDNRDMILRYKHSIPICNCSNVAEAHEFGNGDSPWYLPKSALDYGSSLEFEGERFSVLSNYEEYLKRRYARFQGVSQEEIERTQVPHPIRAYKNG